MVSGNGKYVTESLPSTVGLLGGGVIGGGWAARFILNGVDVRLYDPAPDAAERVKDRLTKARRAFEQLTQVSLPPEGTLTVAASLEEAVTGVQLVQENAPERLEIKQQVLAAACRAAAPETLICSSTSALEPTLLQAKMPRPERLLVAHPYFPVYLIPLVELCAGERTSHEVLARAKEIYTSIGMHPLVMRKEICGFIGTRLQAAAWREALWLVHNDVATVQDIDDAIRYSFGLRLPVLGQFLTYFVGSGEKSMRAFLEKWGPGNKDTSRLVEIPEFSDEFLTKIASQQDKRETADSKNIGDYQEMLDRGIVQILQGLRSERNGAGETLGRWEQSLRERGLGSANTR